LNSNTRPPANSGPPERDEDSDTDLVLDEAEETLKDKAVDALKKFADWVVPRGSIAVAATEIATDLADGTQKANLEHVQKIDGKEVGQTTMFGAVIHAAQGGSAWEGPDGLWYTHPDPNYKPQSHSGADFRSDGRGDINKKGGNGIPDTRPPDHHAKVIGEVAGEHAGGWIKDKIDEKTKKPSYETDRKD
jgi:hypothetical protein